MGFRRLIRIVLATGVVLGGVVMGAAAVRQGSMPSPMPTARTRPPLAVRPLGWRIVAHRREDDE